MHLTFIGATQTVTGSKYLITSGSRKVLIDCGLFQGFKFLRLKNWAPPPFDPREIDAVVLTHAHIDHSGYIPLLVKKGYRGKIFCTTATRELCKILLPDSGYLQEEQASYLGRHNLSKHSPPEPLYTEEDAQRCLKQFESVRHHEDIDLGEGLTARFSRAGHLLGAACVRIAGNGTSILFSGDLGRPDDLLCVEPEPPQPSDYLVLESTYGDRLHPKLDPHSELETAINHVQSRGGIMVVPAFAVGRAQVLMLLIHRLKTSGRIADIPVYLDSPMAIDASSLYRQFPAEHKLQPDEVRQAFGAVRFVRTADESKQLDTIRTPAIILSASGMATGGRVVHHLKRFAPDPRNLILLTGHQAGGTRGASIAAGTRTVRIHREDVPINAQVMQMLSLSGHADADQLVAWAGRMSRPRRAFITHGEPSASDALRQRLEHELQWDVEVPEYREEHAL
ncbi:MAG TPA: MBL fold metallo-hydrolase [Steroidobacteraceae bacterium]|nr:MBL fold metallo-hydrolase [Steroidobacteraceae bacterium]